MRSARLAAVALALVVLAPASAWGAYSPASTNGWFPIVGRAPGPSNAQNRTDLWLFNPDASANATVTLTFHPSAASGAPAGAAVNSVPIVLFPRETKFFPDVTSATVPAGDGFGSLEWNSNVAVMASVHKYLSSVTGTSGGVYGGTPGTEALGARASATDSVNVLQLFGLHSGDANFSTQLDVANTSAVALPIEVRVVQSPSNSILATTSYTVAPKSLLRAGNPFQGLSLDDTLRVTVAVREGTSIPSGGVIASATVTDLRSSDGNVVLGQRQGSGSLATGPCTPDANSLCLNNGRFKVTATYSSAQGSGTGTAIPGTSDTGQFWFFTSQNVEMVVKVLNGCGFNQRYWVFAGGLTNVQVTMTVTDMSNATVKTYTNPLNTAFQPIQDTAAFATCP
ncbi:MAG: hypothetical protein M3167_00695 [Acidobacteriota bacterium]|nr:hypothetical protein [Acidobacteriota bacterium]